MPFLLLPVIAALGWGAFAGASANTALSTPDEVVAKDTGLNLTKIAIYGIGGLLAYVAAKKLIAKI